MSAFLQDLMQALMEFNSFMSVFNSSNWVFPVVAIVAFSIILLIVTDNH